MRESQDKMVEEMCRAISAYTGRVSRCRPGRARAPVNAQVVTNKGEKWIKQNGGARAAKNPRAERRQMRMARAEQQRIAERNALLLKRINK